ncbi:MAG: dienelactone hydrolase family protein [Phycisphaerales bacterium]|nr:dienelactone hydrolase family protein [Phycisphaerales bacterium]
MPGRKELIDLLGPFPSPVEPQASVVESHSCEGYVRERIEYDVESGERVAAYLLRPDVGGRRPAILCHHQHASTFDLGKSEVVGLAGDPDQAVGPELARRGFVVFAPDAIGFEERNWSAPTGRAEYVEMSSRLVRGETLLAKVLHDVSVALDVLEARPEVDSDRIGFFGHSYGGRMAIWATASDPRITCAVSHCGCIGYADSVAHRVGIQPEFCVPGILGRFEIDDVIRMIAPRRFMLSTCTEDTYSMGALAIADAVRDAFPDGAFRHVEWQDGHVLTGPMREAACDFLEATLT